MSTVGVAFGRELATRWTVRGQRPLLQVADDIELAALACDLVPGAMHVQSHMHLQ